MGAACHEVKLDARKKIKKSNIETIENESQNLSIKTNEDKKETRKKEGNTRHAKKVDVDTIIKVRKSICKIICPNIDGTGFFMISNTGLKWLLTNLHIITEDLINKEIKIILYNGSNVNIKLNKRYINFYRKLDITVMEIKESDNIIKDIDFLEYDLSYVNGYDKYENIDAFSLQFQKIK